MSLSFTASQVSQPAIIIIGVNVPYTPVPLVRRQCNQCTGNFREIIGKQSRDQLNVVELAINQNWNLQDKNARMSRPRTCKNMAQRGLQSLPVAYQKERVSNNPHI